EAMGIAESLYGMRTAVAELLPGEHDENVYLKTLADEEYVLKLSHAAESWEALDLQNAALVHLASRTPSLVLPRVRQTLAGEAIAQVSGANGVAHFARMLTYIPGKLLADTRPHSSSLLRDLGRLLGGMDAALADFSHPAAERVLKWDLARSSWTHDYLS